MWDAGLLAGILSVPFNGVCLLPVNDAATATLTKVSERRPMLIIQKSHSAQIFISEVCEINLDCIVCKAYGLLLDNLLLLFGACSLGTTSQ